AEVRESPRGYAGVFRCLLLVNRRQRRQNWRSRSHRTPARCDWRPRTVEHADRRRWCDRLRGLWAESTPEEADRLIAANNPFAPACFSGMALETTNRGIRGHVGTSLALFEGCPFFIGSGSPQPSGQGRPGTAITFKTNLKSPRDAPAGRELAPLEERARVDD